MSVLTGTTRVGLSPRDLPVYFVAPIYWTVVAVDRLLKDSRKVA